MIEKRRNYGRRLRAEHLERRELLAADLGQSFAAPPDASEVVTVTIDEAPLKQCEQQQTQEQIQQQNQQQTQEQIQLQKQQQTQEQIQLQLNTQLKTQMQQQIRQRDGDCEDVALLAVAAEADATESDDGMPLDPPGWRSCPGNFSVELRPCGYFDPQFQAHNGR